MHYKHIFFDLDRTLWDFESNSREALHEIYNDFKLKDRGISSFEAFLKSYQHHNETLWELYRKEIITKEYLRSSRFQLCLADFDINDRNLAVKMGEKYIQESPLKTNLFPYTFEVLHYLSKKYKLHIITNGFEEVQHIKLKYSKLKRFFNHVITSELVGAKKPNPKIFKLALEKAGASVQESLMIGDDFPIDILGAKNIGMDQVFFNPNKYLTKQKATIQISCLSELKELL